MILVDAGPLVALMDRRDQHHSACVEALRSIKVRMVTTWPVITEAMYLLIDLPVAQQGLWEMLERRVVRLLPLDDSDVPRMRELMGKYANRPMDLADASLVRLAERDGLDTVFTVNRADFQVYRRSGRRTFKLMPESLAPKGRVAAKRKARRK